MFKAQFLPHTDLRSSMFGFEVFNRQGIRHHLGVESFSLIPNNDTHAFAVIAAATDTNQLASLQAIAVEHRVTQRFQFERSATEPGFVLQRLQRLETPNANHVSKLLSPGCSPR